MHDSNVSNPPGSPPARGAEERLPYNARLGIWLFLIYLVIYGGFMLLNTFKPEMMAHTPFGGVNLAILYGMFLIVAALVLALVYMVMCRASTTRSEGGR